MSQILIYDANAYLRRSLNQTLDPVNAAPRFIYEAANHSMFQQIWVWDGANNNALQSVDEQVVQGGHGGAEEAHGCIL